jgi:RimJ/RimL family protein N-acetyltransferase
MNPLLMDVPMPIRTPRLEIRGTRPGDGAATMAALEETWAELHAWMRWAEDKSQLSEERQELRIREVMAKAILREEFNLVGVEVATGELVVWTGFHGLDWAARQCETGYWVRKSAQGRGFATEAAHALVRYAFGALGMRRVGIAHAAGNEASRRVIEKLGFAPEGVMRGAMLLPGGRIVDRVGYARLDMAGLPELDVRWGGDEGR